MFVPRVVFSTLKMFMQVVIVSFNIVFSSQRIQQNSHSFLKRLNCGGKVSNWDGRVDGWRALYNQTRHCSAGKFVLLIQNAFSLVQSSHPSLIALLKASSMTWGSVHITMATGGYTVSPFSVPATTGVNPGRGGGGGGWVYTPTHFEGGGGGLYKLYLSLFKEILIGCWNWRIKSDSYIMEIFLNNAYSTKSRFRTY